MATELFIEQSLTQEMISAGKSLIERLEDSNAEVYAAFWKLDNKEKPWKLVIISPLVESEGPLKYFKRINGINNSVSENIISLHNIDIANTKNNIFNMMLKIKNSVLHNGLNTRLGENFLDGIYFEDMYIYKL